MSMQPEFWLERWKSNEIGFHQQEINTHLQEYWPRLRVPAGGAVFVPLCGKSRDMLWLRAQGYTVLGVEISPLAVRDFFAENRLSATVTTLPSFECWQADGITLFCGDFFRLTAGQLERVAGVYDRASLIALPPAMRERYVAMLGTILPVMARMLLVTMDYPNGEMQGPPFAVSETEVRALYEQHFQVEHLFTKDILAENPRFVERGLTRLVENVYGIQPKRA